MRKRRSWITQIFILEMDHPEGDFRALLSAWDILPGLSQSRGCTETSCGLCPPLSVISIAIWVQEEGWVVGITHAGVKGLCALWGKGRCGLVRISTGSGNCCKTHYGAASHFSACKGQARISQGKAVLDSKGHDQQLDSWWMASNDWSTWRLTQSFPSATGIPTGGEPSAKPQVPLDEGG